MPRRLVLLFLGALLLPGCAVGESAEDGAAPSVVASVYPLAFVAESVAGDAARVVSLTPAGVEPHDIELTSGQLMDIVEAELVVYVGGGFQPAVEAAIEEAGGGTIDVLEAVDPRPADAAEEHEDDDEHGEHAANVDPHVWLDPVRMASIGELLGEALSDLDPDGAAIYERNARRLARRLLALDQEFQSGLDECRADTVVVSHEAFGYLADRYDFQQLGIAGIDPESEPSPQRIAEISRFVRDHGVEVVFFERLVSPRVARTIASESGARTEVLDPLESEPAAGDYVTAMRANLSALRGALGCR